MDRHAAKEIKQEHNGRTYTFPLGVDARNVETDSDHKFVTSEQLEKLEDANDALNHIEAELEQLRKIIGGKADILTVNRTVYVSGSGSDTGGDGSASKPYRSIQHALENVPVINGNYEYTISIAGGTYSGFIAKNVSATIHLEGNITISGSGTYPIEIDDSNIKINGNDHMINISGNAGGALFYIHNGGRINIYKGSLTLTGTGSGRGIYIVSDGGFSQTASGISFNNLDTAVNVGTNSVFYSDGLYGNATNGIVTSAGGRVTYAQNTMQTVTPVQTISGGRVYSGSQELTL